MPTATGLYTNLTELKIRLGITDSTDDAQLTSITGYVNQGIESHTGRALASTTMTNALFDGYSALENGRLLLFPRGVRSVSSVEVATYTGGTFTTVATSDVFIRPTAQERDPGWPGTELWMTDIPSSSTSVPYFPPGFANIRISGTGGWAAMPDDAINVGYNIAVGIWRGRSAQGGDTFAIGPDGQRTFNRYLSEEDRMTLDRYRIKSITVI